MTNKEIKQFTYDPMKAIMKFSNFQTREKLSLHVIGLQKVEALFPHQFDRVEYGDNIFRIKIGDITREWAFSRGMGPDSHCFVNVTTSPRRRVDYIVNNFEPKKTNHVAMLKLLKDYLRDGSKIDVLYIFGIPEDTIILNSPISRSELGNIKLKVKKLHLNRVSQVILHSWLPLISDEEPIQEIRFNVNRQAMFMFDEPVVQHCHTLKIRFFDLHDNSLPLENCFGKLQNAHVNVQHSAFPMRLLEVLIRKWVYWRRPLGTSFSLGIKYYTTVLDAFDMAVADIKGVPSIFPDLTNYCRHCCTVPVDGELEVVIFGRRKFRQHPQNFEWELRAEVMKKGTTVPK